MNGQVLRNKYEREGDRVPDTTRPWDSLPTLMPASPASPYPGLRPSTELCHRSPMLSPRWGAAVPSSPPRCTESSALTPSLHAAAITLLTLGQVSSLPQTPEKPLCPCDED